MALKFKNLDRLTIRKLQPGQRLAEHGITFERLPNGDGCRSFLTTMDQ